MSIDMEKKLVSVIIPIYNCSVLLRKCLNSIKQQTYLNWEVILVDDGSVDGSGVICDEYCYKDDRFIVIHKVNEGVSKARIEGFNASKGRYVFFVDADDFIEPNTLEIVVDEIERKCVDVVVCETNKVLGTTIAKENRSIKGIYDADGIKRLQSTNLLYDIKYSQSGLALYLWGKLYRREVLADVLSRGEGFWYGEDMIIILALVQNISSICIIDIPLYNYVIHQGQVTKKPAEELFDAYLKLWKKISEEDDRGYFAYQLPARMFGFIRSLLVRQIDNSYVCFKLFFDEIRSNDFVIDKLFNCVRRPAYGVKSVLLFYLFRYNCPSLFYGLISFWAKFRKRHI